MNGARPHARDTSIALALLAVVVSGTMAALSLGPRADPTRPNGMSVCRDGIRLEIGEDRAMQRVAGVLRRDERLVDLATETQEQALARFHKIFVNRPDLLRVVRKESLPASVVVLPARGVDRTRLAEALPREHPVIKDVRDPCRFDMDMLLLWTGALAEKRQR